jgi:hypothetical protein
MLGRQFLTSAYLSVNQDENTFSLWSTKSTTSSQIVAIKDFGCGTPDSPANAPSTSTNASLPTDHAHADDHHNVSTPAAVAAIAISCLFLVGLSISVLFMCIRSKKQKAEEAEESSKRMSFMDRGLQGDAAEISGVEISGIETRDIGRTEGKTAKEAEYEMWAGEADVFEMSTPAASWTPLGQQKTSVLPPVDGVGGWPLQEKGGSVTVAELPAG